MERFLRYLDPMVDHLSLDSAGKVTEILSRVLLDEYRTIARGEYEMIRESLALGVEILRRKPELLAQLLVDSGVYAWETVHDLATCEFGPPCGLNCRRILRSVETGPDDAASERDP